MAYLIDKSTDTHGNLFELVNNINYFAKCPERGNIKLFENDTDSSLFQIENKNNSFILKTDETLYINGLRKTSISLQDNDEIEINNSFFKFILGDDFIYKNSLNNILFCQSDRFIINEKLLTITDNPDVDSSSNISTYQKTFQQLYLSSSLDSFILKSIQIFKNTFNTSRVLFFIWDENSCSFEKHNISDKHDDETEFYLSKTVLSYMLINKKSLLCQDLINDKRFNESESLFKQLVHSIMSAPLIVNNSIHGFIYVDSTDPSVTFSENDFDNFNMIIQQISFLLYHFKKSDKLDKLNHNFDEILSKNLKIIGEDSKYTKTLKLASRVAKTDISVIIKGESGSGKELIAKYIHQSSLKKHKEMINVNCAAINDNLFESEFFGHVKGAFTGAIDNRKGFFELSNESTIFLDEVGELSLTNQAKLLRVLQEKEFYKVGGVKPLKVAVRVIAATNADLKQLMKENKFREDLYYRLNGIQINVPSLRERTKDIKILSEFFIHNYSKKYKVPKKVLSEDALNILNSYRWPGNIRELKHKVEQAMILTESSEITSTDFIDCIEIIEQNEDVSSNLQTKSFKDAISNFEKDYFIDLLKKTKGNVSASSKISGLERSYLYQKLKKNQLQPDSFR